MLYSQESFKNSVHRTCVHKPSGGGGDAAAPPASGVGLSMSYSVTMRNLTPRFEALGLAAIAASLAPLGILLGVLLLPRHPIEAPPIRPLPALSLPPALIERDGVDRTHKGSRLVPFAMPDNPAAKGTYPGLDTRDAPIASKLPLQLQIDPEPSSRARRHIQNDFCRRYGRRQVWVSSKRWRCLR